MTSTTGDLGPGRAVLRATLVGTVLQLAVGVSGHYEAAVANRFAVLGIAISLLAGFLCGRWLARAGKVHAAVGGLVAGAVCALLGILESWSLGDVPAWVLAFGTTSSAVAGVIGGSLGRLTRR
jgi:hypothetical protein